MDKKIIERLESELLLRLVDYVLPVINKKIKTRAINKDKTKNLENLVNSKPKISFEDIKELESILLKNLTENVKVNKDRTINSGNVFYSLNLMKKKNINDKSNNYSISINYEENQKEDNLKISVKQAENELYSAEIKTIKDIKDNVIPYGLSISYEDNYAEERLAITHKQQLKNYLQKHIQEKEDMSSRVPLKWLNILPETMMGGVLGFTYIGDHSMGRRADLTGSTARMVDIHESIHTPDEYETRVLTSWIMEKVKGRYVK
ncbi:hypothetical protein HYW20_03060 [Candidatus Woesearchaeota archaeon]|nr:hypothetical protein [Candidatus Woesearchaeota archaeon]